LHQQEYQVTDTKSDRPRVTVASEYVINRQGKDFVLWTGLLDAAHRAGLMSITTTIVQCPSSLNKETAIVHATAEFPWGTYSGIGDADDQNVSRNIAPHKIRMAETRAKARALRDGLNIGVAAFEELGPDMDDRPAKQGEDGVGTAAPRRVVKAEVQTTPTPAPAPVMSTAVDQEREKFTRLAATAQRLGLKTVTLTDDAPLEYIVEQRNTLLREVNQVLAKQRASAK
jgi:hypothetical protein